MNEASPPSVVARVGAAITTFRNFVFNTLFLLFIVVLIAAVVASCESVKVPKDGALVINPRGILVEEVTLANPLQGLVNPGTVVAESAFGDVLRAVDIATADDDIRMIVLQLDELIGATPSQAQVLGAKLEAFKAAGKKVAAYGYFFNQGQYHLASFADALYMHPMGQVLLPGFGTETLYFKGLFERFGVNVHVFRVGDYKAAVEPFTRSDMSEEARLANETLYQNIWQHVVNDIARNRALDRDTVLAYANNITSALKQTKGDLARAAIENNLVDELLTSDQARIRFGDDVGLVDGELNSIDYLDYVGAKTPALNLTSDRVAVVVAQGPIFTGAQVGGIASADAIIHLIRHAKQTPSIKALVLRVDSPGGSSFASELIRQELELLQLAGKPVVASFASTAASGGYWIAATADAIVAEPTTITGSIGIFSILTTFEDTLANVGIDSDGVGTTPMSTGYSTLTGLSDAMANVLQASVENGYRQFTDLVARGRNLDSAAVEKIAQGRVWTGEVALDLGLVDELGDLEAAVNKAANLAQLEDWTTEQLKRPLNPRDVLLAELLARTQTARAENLTAMLPNPLLRRVQDSFTWLARLSDPGHAYALCLPCIALAL